MPHFISPMIRRRPDADKLGTDPRAIQESAPSPIVQSIDFSQTAPPSTEQGSEQFEEQQQIPPDVRVSEGGFRQIRDESLVLLSQGITHRIERSEEGPFQIFVEPEKRRAAQFQIRLYHRENPPRDENPPLPLKFTLHPLWVLAIPIVCTLLDFSDISIQMHNAGIADASKILRGEWWRTITAMTLHADSRHLASNLVSGFLALSLLHYRIPREARAVPGSRKRCCQLLRCAHSADKLPFARLFRLRICNHRLPRRHRVPSHATRNARYAPSLCAALRRRIARRIPRSRRKRRHSRALVRIHRGAPLRIYPHKKSAPLGNAISRNRHPWGPRLLRFVCRRLDSGHLASLAKPLNTTASDLLSHSCHLAFSVR